MCCGKGMEGRRSAQERARAVCVCVCVCVCASKRDPLPTLLLSPSKTLVQDRSLCPSFLYSPSLLPLFSLFSPSLLSPPSVPPPPPSLSSSLARSLIEHSPAGAGARPAGRRGATRRRGCRPPRHRSGAAAPIGAAGGRTWPGRGGGARPGRRRWRPSCTRGRSRRAPGTPPTPAPPRAGSCAGAGTAARRRRAPGTCRAHEL